MIGSRKVFAMRNALAGTMLLLFCASLAFAQQKPKSHEACIKQVPGDWGPNFGAEWHQNEALYWACRDGVSVSTVEAWQKAVGEYGMAHEFTPVTVKGQKLVLFVEDQGSANCYGLSVLRRAGGAWTLAWRLTWKTPDGEDGEYCTGNCPGIKAHMKGEILTVQSPTSSDDRCKHVSWHNQRFRWNGSTFAPLK
jgi:hypothetical protein